MRNAYTDARRDVVQRRANGHGGGQPDGNGASGRMFHPGKMENRMETATRSIGASRKPGTAGNYRQLSSHIHFT